MLNTALWQIQRRVGQTWEMIDKLERFKNIIRVRRIEGEDDMPSLLEARDGTIYVKTLNETLAHVSTDWKYALDETPINVDSPLLTSYKLSKGHPLAKGPASI